MRNTAATIAAGENRLRHLALHDPLCGLPNRNFFSERLEEVIADVKGGGPPAAAFYIDLDHFKDVNDTLGHPIGDELIREVTLRLSRMMRGDDLVARLGGDEFAVITSGTSDSSTLQAIANRIIATLCAPYSINRPHHRHRRQHRHRGDRSPLRRQRRRHHALCRHGPLPGEKRRPQPRLHVRRGDGCRSVAAQAGRAGPARGDRDRRPQGAVSADRQRQRREDRRRGGAGALAASDPRSGLARRVHSDRRAFGPDHRARRARAAARLPRRPRPGRGSASPSMCRRCSSASSTLSTWSSAS